MRENCRFLWLEGVFDEKTLSDFPSVSIAANAWQKGFIGGLQELGHEVKIFGFPYERIWPLGRLFIDSCQANLAKGFTGNVVGYLNFPFLRDFFRYKKMLSLINNYFEHCKKKPD